MRKFQALFLALTLTISMTSSVIAEDVPGITEEAAVVSAEAAIPTATPTPTVTPTPVPTQAPVVEEPVVETPVVEETVEPEAPSDAGEGNRSETIEVSESSDDTDTKKPAESEKEETISKEESAQKAETLNDAGETTSYTVRAIAKPADAGSAVVVTTPDTEDGKFYEETEVTLKATVTKENYKFVNWTDKDGAEISKEKEIKFAVKADTEYTANFAEKAKYTVTASVNPSDAGTASVEGTATEDGKYYEGDSVTVKAVADTGYTFVNWTDKDGVEISKNAEYSFDVKADTEYTANFAEKAKYTVNTSVNPSDAGTVVVTTPDTEDGKYYEGTKVTLEATAKDGFYFINWTAMKDGKEVPVSEKTAIEFTVTKDIDFTANFGKYINITTAVNPAKGGTVSEGGKFKKDENFTLKATANEGYYFVNWTVDGKEVSTKADATFKAEKDAVYTANFEKYINITAAADPSKAGTVSGAGQYKKNESVTVSATANKGYKFVKWTQDGKEVSTKEKFTFKASKDASLTANYVKVYTVTYVVEGDSEYNTPSDSKTPASVNDVEEGTKYKLADVPTTKWETSNGKSSGKSGKWTFAGWYSDKEYKNEVKTLTVKADTTVYGKWTFKKNSNGSNSNTKKGSSKDKTTKSAAKTGDTTNLWMPVSLLLISAVCILLVFRRKFHGNQDQ